MISRNQSQNENNCMWIYRESVIQLSMKLLQVSLKPRQFGWAFFVYSLQILEELWNVLALCIEKT